MAAKLIGNMEECDEKQQRNHRSVPPPPRLHPWLMFTYGKNKRNQTFYSLSENCVHIKSIPSMRRKIYAGSYFGWMILLSEFDSDGSFLLNPVSMEKNQLPPWGNFKHRSCLLLSPPNDPHCLILFLEAVGLGHASFRFCKPGDTVWFHQDLKIGKEEVVIEIVFCGGRIYAHLSSPDCWNQMARCFL